MFDISTHDNWFCGANNVIRIIAKWECYTPEKVSLKKLIFNAAFDNNVYFIFFDKSSLPTEEAIQNFVAHCIHQSINIDYNAPEIEVATTQVEYSYNNIVIPQKPSTNMFDLLEGKRFGDENEYIFKPTITESIWMSPLWFELYMDNGGLTLSIIYDNEERLNTYAALYNDRVKFINFNNIEFDI